MDATSKYHQTKSIQSSSTTRPLDNQSIKYANQLHKLRQNQPFMAMMGLLFEHCDATDIAQLLKYSGLAGSISSISIETCCRNTPELADKIKQDARIFFTKPLFSSEFYLSGREAELLLNICDFGFAEEKKTISDKINALKKLLFIEKPSDHASTTASSTTQNNVVIENLISSPCSGPQDKGSIALKSAKSFEKKFLDTIHAPFPDTPAYGKAAQYYIKAAMLGNVEAKDWLKSTVELDASSVRGNTAKERIKVYNLFLAQSSVSGQIWLALGDINSKEGASKELIDQCYEKAWDILYKQVFSSSEPDAIQRLYDHPIGNKPASEINQILDELLLNQISSVSLQDENATYALDWILRVFSFPNLPPSYNAKREEALLKALHNIEFTSPLARKLFRYQEREFEQTRTIVEAKLNKMLGIDIKLHFVATSLNHDTFLICAENKNDNDRFAEAIKKSDLAKFFSPSTNLLSEFDNDFLNSLVLTEESWREFTTLLSAMPPITV
jgi:hypothetical protein